MATRATTAQLHSIIDRINTMTNSPMRPYDIDESSGKYVPQAGCYHLSQAYGGYALHRMSLQAGCTGVTDPLGRGYMPKRELAELMYAFMRGMESASEQV